MSGKSSANPPPGCCCCWRWRARLGLRLAPVGVLFELGDARLARGNLRAGAGGGLVAAVKLCTTPHSRGAAAAQGLRRAGKRGFLARLATRVVARPRAFSWAFCSALSVWRDLDSSTWSRCGQSGYRYGHDGTDREYEKAGRAASTTNTAGSRGDGCVEGETAQSPGGANPRRTKNPYKTHQVCDLVLEQLPLAVDLGFPG